ncbi:MAG: hypothetical protein EOO88_31630 [Pedobacter sp.]|nr:MAG: hypothetical protein EOO88_31630 [Pedobacter sp.]
MKTSHLFLIFLVSISIACGSKNTEAPEAEVKPGPFAGKIMSETLSGSNSGQWRYLYQDYGLWKPERIDVLSNGQLTHEYSYEYPGSAISQNYKIYERKLQQDVMSSFGTTEFYIENARLVMTDYRPATSTNSFSRRNITYNYSINNQLKNIEVLNYDILNAVTTTEDHVITNDQNGNVIKISKKTYLSGQLQSTTTISYTYDNKTNPKKGLGTASDIAAFFSPNNWLTMTEENNNARKVTTRIYTYNTASQPTSLPASFEETVDGTNPQQTAIAYFK